MQNLWREDAKHLQDFFQNDWMIKTLFPSCPLAAADSFKFKDFFQKVGLHGKSNDALKEAFQVIDQDGSGYVEEEELK